MGWERRCGVANRYSPLVVLLIAVLAIVLGVAVTGRRAESGTGRVGRFQIASGCYFTSIGESIFEKDDIQVSTCGIFRIDTVTGETWIYKERVNTQSVLSNEIAGEWIPVD
jgi:hypothetical protein